MRVNWGLSLAPHRHVFSGDIKGHFHMHWWGTVLESHRRVITRTTEKQLLQVHHIVQG